MTVASTPYEHEVVDPVNFSASDVTGMKSLEVDGVDGHFPASDVAARVAELMELPSNSVYAFRDNTNARMLVDDRPLGSQIDKDSQLTLVPKSHMG